LQPIFKPKPQYMTNDFVPSNEGELIQWAANVQGKITNYTATFGLLPTDLTAISNACNRIATDINNVTAAETTLANLVTLKNNNRAEDIATLRRYANQFKAHSAYTDDIGADLDIVGKKHNADPDTVKPKLKGKLTQQGAQLDFSKEKVLQGVNIYSRLKGTAAWGTKLAFDSSSPYIDNRPAATPGTPETREYKAVGVINDEEVGVASDIVSVVVGG
jgi:hypothetical protein